MTETIDAYIGTAEDMGQRFIEAWNRAERERPRMNPADVSSFVRCIGSSGSDPLTELAERD